MSAEEFDQGMELVLRKLPAIALHVFIRIRQQLLAERRGYHATLDTTTSSKQSKWYAPRLPAKKRSVQSHHLRQHLVQLHQPDDRVVVQKRVLIGLVVPVRHILSYTHGVLRGFDSHCLITSFAHEFLPSHTNSFHETESVEGYAT